MYCMPSSACGWMAGAEISETILVTETGCETLTNLPRDIFVKA